MADKKKKTVPEPIPSYRVWFTNIIICVILFSVFAVRLHVEKLTGMSLYVFAHNNGIYADWFLYCKEMTAFFAAVAAALYTIGERIFPDKPCRDNPLFRKKAVLPAVCICVYVLMSLLSALFSQHKEVVWKGVCTEFEGSMAVLAYGVIFLFGYNFVSGGKSLRFFRGALTAVTAAAVLLSIFEYAVKPVLELPFMKYLIAPAQYREAAASLRIGNTFREAVLMFYNSNYAGSFFVLVFPAAILSIAAAKKPARRIGTVLLSAGVFAAGVMTNATAAFYIMAAELGVLVVYFIVKRVISLKLTAIAIAAFAVLTVGLDLATGREFSLNIIKSMTNSGTYSGQESVYRLSGLTLDGKQVHFSGEESGYTVIPPYESGEELEIKADTGTVSTITQEDFNLYTIHDPATGNDIGVRLTDGVLFLDFGYKGTIDIAVTTSGVQLITQNSRLISEIPSAPMSDSSLTRYYSFATGRGYIWLNSLPILKDCIFIGRGAGNFPFYFQQNDVVGLCNTEGTYRFVIDKPHSMYLQIAISCGIPALVAVLVLLFTFMAKGIAVCISADRSELTRNGDMALFIGLCAGIGGYMTAGIVNDSCVTVAPVFWLCFGAAYGMLDTFRKGEKKC